MKDKKMNLKLYDFNLTYEDICNKQNFIVFNSDIKCLCVVIYDEILKNAIFSFYNKYNLNNNINDNRYEKRVSDADIYQILVSHMHASTYDELNKDIKKLKNVKNFEILYYIYFENKTEKQTNKFFIEDINIENIKKNEKNYKLIYEVIDYNNTELINKILDKFDKPNNLIEEDKSGEIDNEKMFIFILCYYKKEEEIVKKIYNIFKKTNFDLYKINKAYRTFLPLILNKFMYLFPEKEKILIYKSMAKYYEEMYYNFYFIEKENFEQSLNHLNNGFSYEILDFYFENFDIDYDTCKVDDIIIDYFYKYLYQIYTTNKIEKTFQEFLIDIYVNKSYEISDKKYNNVYECYLMFVFNRAIDKGKLFTYCDDNYLHLKEIKDEDEMMDLLSALALQKKS